MKPLELLETKGPRLWVVQLAEYFDFKKLPHPPGTNVAVRTPSEAIAAANILPSTKSVDPSAGIRTLRLPLENKWFLLPATDFSDENIIAPWGPYKGQHSKAYAQLIELTDGEGEVAPVYLAVVEVTELL